MVNGVQMRSMGRTGWGYEKISRGDGENSLIIPDLRWEMALRLDFGMVYGAGIKLLKKLFWICIVLFALSASVADYLELSSDSHMWNVSFIKAAQDWEVDAFVLFFNLYSLRLSQGREYKLHWAPSKRGMIIVNFTMS